ncbi:MAG TPA: hypothetical protein VFB63_09735 [Bryobacteraceae bacterium]|nr:hypothetical protein [Bryobacteraceae bacterium]
MRRMMIPLTAMLAMSVCALAQPAPQPLTMVAIFKVKPNKTSDWVAVMKGVYAPVLDQLLKDGVITAYGADMDLLHQAGKPNASAWIAMPNWASVQKVNAAIEEAQRKNPGQMVRALEATDPEAHSDLLLRSPVFQMKTPAAGALPVTTFTMNTVKQGKNDAYTKLYDEHIKPVLDQLLQQGAILGYGVDVEVEHSMPVGTRVEWIMMPDLAARDKVDAAFREARGRLTEDGRRVLQANFQEALEREHKDWTSKSVVFAAK